MSLKALAIVSGVYDLLLAVPLLVAAPRLALLFDVPAPQPLIHAQLNGMFTLVLAVGYFWAAADIEGRRGYLWIAGVLAKGLGAALFVLDHLRGGSPASFLLFAFTDGLLAVLTLALLLKRPAHAAAHGWPGAEAASCPHHSRGA